MFCNKCGKELGPEIKFCSGCGNNLAGGEVTNKEIINKDEIIAVVKPSFVIPKQILVLLKEGLIGVFLLMYMSRGRILQVMIMNPGITLIIMAVVGAIKIVLSKYEYDHLVYTFYGDRVEYIDGFLNKTRKNVKYKSIKEINIERTVFDRIFGLGKIRIKTSAESKKGTSGIKMTDLVNAEDVYEKIKGIEG